MTRQSSRIAFLRERVETAERSAGRQTFDVPFRQRSHSLVKIDVPISFPLYNVNSGRTHTAQRAWIEERSKPTDFFTDPEDEVVQSVQHALLKEMISIRNLAEDLQSRQQRNPVVLTYDGFIVDGNRRIAALREAGEVENVTAVVLPADATALEVYETELELQMARETRAEYDWIDRALHVRRGVDHLHESSSAIAQRMNMPITEVDDILGRLVLVDLYLEWRGFPEAYHRVPADSEQSFIELREREGRQQFRTLTEAHRQAIRLACFAVIQSSDGGYKDVRRVADSIRNQPEAVVTRLRDRLPDDLASRLDEGLPTTEDQREENEDLLSQLAAASADAVVPAGTEVINVVRAPTDAHISAPLLIDVAREITEEGRETAAHLEPLRKLERVLSVLRSIRITGETRQLSVVANRLEELITEAERVAGQVARHSSGG